MYIRETITSVSDLERLIDRLWEDAEKVEELEDKIAELEEIIEEKDQRIKELENGEDSED